MKCSQIVQRTAWLLVLAVLVGCSSGDRTDSQTGDSAAAAPAVGHGVRDHQGVRSEQDQAAQTEREQPVVDAIQAAGGRWVRLDGAVISVDLTECPFDDEQCRQLADLADLRDLKIWGANIGDEAIGYLPGLAKLQSLGLENSELTDDGLAAVAKLSTLKSLNLRRCSNVTNRGGRARCVTAGLEQIHLLYTNISDDALAHLVSLKKLRLVDIRGCVLITGQRLEHLGQLKTLRSLKMRNPQVSDVGLKAIEGPDGPDVVDSRGHRDHRRGGEVTFRDDKASRNQPVPHRDH